jgi:hypothetical protein
VYNRLQRMDLPCIDEAIRPYYRDVHDHVIHVNESIDILREMLSAAFLQWSSNQCYAEGSLVFQCTREEVSEVHNMR